MPHKTTVKEIFQTNDNWQHYKAKNPNLPIDAINEVEKMLHCRDLGYGFLTYKCPECREVKSVD